MGNSVFLFFDGDAKVSARLAKWYREQGVRWLRDLTQSGAGISNAGQISGDLFLPAKYQNELFDDGPPPAAVVQLTAGSAADLSTIMSIPEFDRILRCPQAADNNQCYIASECANYSLVETAVSAQSKIVPRRAGLSFLVRYYSPIPNESGFQRAYIDSHLPILATFPKIRNVRVYLPLDGVGSARLINEVVFDDDIALDLALKSPVMAALKADSARLPPRAGNSHHAMSREMLLV